MYNCIYVYMYNCIVWFFVNMVEYIYMYGVKFSKYGWKFCILLKLGGVCVWIVFLDLNVFLNNVVFENV